MLILSEETREADIILLNYDAGNLRVEIEAKMEEAEKFTKRNDKVKTATENAEEESEQLKEQLSTIDAELEQLAKKTCRCKCRNRKMGRETSSFR